MRKKHYWLEGFLINSKKCCKSSIVIFLFISFLTLHEYFMECSSSRKLHYAPYLSLEHKIWFSMVDSQSKLFCTKWPLIVLCNYSNHSWLMQMSWLFEFYGIWILFPTLQNWNNWLTSFPKPWFRKLTIFPSHTHLSIKTPFIIMWCRLSSILCT